MIPIKILKSKLLGKIHYGKLWILSKTMSRSDKEKAGEILFNSFGGVLVQNSGICNARCIFCPYRFSDNRGKIMSDEVFEKVVEFYVKICGGGDILAFLR